ncbi:MAG: Clp protease ClpP [Steroidobacteraceae bacterium]|nr:Clp protease ClpP [Steroidobacteraceae bacterium]
MSIDIQARGANKAEIRIFGPIGDDWLGDGVTAQSFDEQIKALGEVSEIKLRINSEGGSVFDGVAIYNALRAHPARVIVSIEGIAASSASLIAMAGDVIQMGVGTQMMIHSPWQLVAGNAEQLRKAAGVLDQVEHGMIDAYQARTKLPRDEIKRMLDAETWLSPSDAIEKGFADEMLPTPAARAALDLSRFRNVPVGVLAMTTQTQPNAEEILAAETTRRRAIRAVFSARCASEHRALLDECLDDPSCTVDKAREKLLAKLGEQYEPLGAPVVTSLPQQTSDFVAAATDALLMRAGIHVEKPHAAARDVRTMSVIDMARACLSQRGKSHAGMAPGKLIKAALTTSDFPSILENALGKALRNGYESDPQSHTAWVNRTMVPDFKTQSRLLLGSAPSLERVYEAGEYKYGSLDENKATLAVQKFGKALRLSWETLINDDLGAFMRVPQAMGAAARRAEADAVYDLFSANSGSGQTMQDGVALFDTSHGNVSATVGPISTTTLGAARALLRKQTALGNGGYLNLNPRYLIVPAESETLAEQVMAQATRHVTDTTATNNRRLDAPTPEWISRLQLVVEPRLNANYGFYVAAHWSQIDTCELATLEADGGEPVIEEENEFDRDARAYKVRHSFVAKFIDWKGVVRVPAS